MPSNSDASNLIAQKLYSKKISERHPDRLRRTQLPALAVWAVVIERAPVVCRQSARNPN